MATTSSLYYDIDKYNEVYSPLIEKVEKYANEHHEETFLLEIPKSDLNEAETYKQDGCFIIMKAGYKIALVNAFASEDCFEDYEEDVMTIINFLYSNYEYRTVLGRFSKWGEQLLERRTIKDMDDLDTFWQHLKAKDLQEVKNTEILVSLCTGSINDIERVKKGVPETLLDQVKQKIQAFDADQTRFIYQERSDKKVIKIQGLSGTGKTELLLHKLKELYQKPEKYSIFVTCHNKILADSLRKRIPGFFNFMKVKEQIEWEERLWCTNAWGNGGREHSGLYRYICYCYNLSFQPYSFLNSFDAVCKNAIAQLKTLQKLGKFTPVLDYILVDECQDFKDSFIELCSMVVRKKVYVAGDIFQSIFAESNESVYEADTFLTKCYRTDPKTLMFAHGLGLGLFETHRLRWLQREDWEACGYQVEDKHDTNQIILSRQNVRRFMDSSDSSFQSMKLVGFNEDNMFAKLIDTVNEILKEHPTATVNDFCIILLDSDQSIYTLANRLEGLFAMKLGWRVNKAYESKTKEKDQLLISNRNNVKGLEYPFVICISKKLSQDYSYRNAVYTMLTRSFIQTILFMPDKGHGLTTGIGDGYREIMKSQSMTINIPSDEEMVQIETRFKEAKNRKPLVDILKAELAKFNLDKESSVRVLQAATSLAWEGLSDEEISYRLTELVKLA